MEYAIIATTFQTVSRMYRILLPRLLHLERGERFTRELRPATGGSSTFMAESFISEHQTGLSGVTLSETGSGKAPLSHRDRPFARGDPYRLRHRRPLRETARPYRQEEETSVSKRQYDAAYAWCLPGRTQYMDWSSLRVKGCSPVVNTILAV